MSRPSRYFISPEQVNGSRIIVSGEDVRHIVTVLRLKPGDMLALCDGKGVEYTVKIAEVGRSEITTEILSQSKRDVRYPLITLGQGLPKSDKMDFIVQKATELGARTIVPLVTERTIFKLRDEQKRIIRWQKIAREASMQSNRPDIPLIGQVRPFRDFIFSLDTGPLTHAAGSSAPEPMTLNLLPWEGGTAPIKDVLRTNSGVEKVIVLIGPEGGFSAQEAETAKGKGFHLVSLGPNILRTETAAVAALSMILYETSANNQISR